MSEDGAHQQSHQVGRGFLSLPGMWGFDGGLLQLSCSLAPHESPVSSFMRPSFLIHRHWLNEQPALLGGQGRKFFSFHPGSAGRLFPDPHLRQNPEGSAEEGRFRTANLLRRVPSRVGRGLWPGTGWGGWGGCGGLPLSPPPLRPARGGWRLQGAGRCLPLLAAYCRLRSPLGCPEWPSGSLAWPLSPPSHSWARENLPEALLGRGPICGER